MTIGGGTSEKDMEIIAQADGDLTAVDFVAIGTSRWTRRLGDPARRPLYTATEPPAAGSPRGPAHSYGRLPRDAIPHDIEVVNVPAKQNDHVPHRQPGWAGRAVARARRPRPRRRPGGGGAPEAWRDATLGGARAGHREVDRAWRSAFPNLAGGPAAGLDAPAGKGGVPRAPAVGGRGPGLPRVQALWSATRKWTVREGRARVFQQSRSARSLAEPTGPSSSSRRALRREPDVAVEKDAIRAGDVSRRAARRLQPGRQRLGCRRGRRVLRGGLGGGEGVAGVPDRAGLERGCRLPPAARQSDPRIAQFGHFG